MSFAAARAEFERLALENKLHLEQLANVNRQIEQEKIREKNIFSGKNLELVAGTACCPQPDKQQIGPELKNVVRLLEHVVHEQGLLETQAQELYFGAETVLAAVDGNMLYNAANLSTIRRDPPRRPVTPTAEDGPPVRRRGRRRWTRSTSRRRSTS